jgi:hypothetical protein
VHLVEVWSVWDDSRITADITQYERRSKFTNGEPAFDGVLKHETVTVKDMSPVIWEPAGQNDRIVMRLMPSLSDRHLPEDLARLPVVGSDVVIADNKGALWARNLNFSGIYIAFTTYQGTIALSYYPFPGAKRIGTAHDHKIELQLDDRPLVTVTSTEQILPVDVNANVYGIFLPERKSVGLNSVSTSDSDNAESFLRRLER